MNASRVLRRVMSMGIAAVLLAGCGGSQLSTGEPAASPQVASAYHRHNAPSFLYLGECCRHVNNGSITLYDLGLTGVARTITKGVSTPFSITVDGAGRLYAINSLDDRRGVVEYDPGVESPSRRIRQRNAWTAATDGSDDLYVASCPACHPYGSGKGAVDVYEGGTTTLLRSIEDGIESPVSLAFDTDGNLYVLNFAPNTTSVIVYAPGSSKPLRRLALGSAGPAAMALDASNDLFVMRYPNGSAPNVVEYEAGSDKVLRIITKGISSPQAIAIDDSGTLYVSNTPFPSRGWVSVYSPGALAPNYRITSHMHDPQLLTVDADGNLYVGNDYYAVALDGRQTRYRVRGSLCVYAPSTKMPLRCVPNDRYSYPYSLAVQAR